MKKSKFLALLLALAMALLLTACQVDIPGVGTLHIGDGKEPAGNNGDTGNNGTNNGNTGDDMGGVNIGGDYDDSIDLLRESMADPSYLFAAAFIGSSAGGPDDLELPLPEWILETDPELCAQYTFIRQIPRERVVGSGGSLFCVVPRDPNATLAVNRIQWNPQNEDYDNLEVLYRSESGEPILLYACADMGESPYPDTEVIVTDSKGRTITWYPIYGAAMLPYDFDNDAPIGYDFTDYGGEYDGDIGWTYPTAEQLANVWVWEGYKDEQYSFGTLTLHANGNAALTWWYEKDAGKAQEAYEGTWKLQGEDNDQLALNMALVDGERYKSGSTVKINGSFPVQVPPGFEDFTILNIAEDANGELLPFQVPPSTLIYLVPAAG